MASRRIEVEIIGSSRGLQAALGRSTAALEGFQRRFERGSRTLASAGGSLTRNVTLPILGVAGAAGKLAYDYDTAMNHVQALTGASEKQTRRWSNELLALGPKVAQSPQELANTLYFVASSGAKVNQVLPITKASAEAAASGMGDAETVAQLLTSAMNAYGPKALSARKATDELTQAIKVGKAEPEELASSIGRVIPLAQAMGVSFGESAGTVAELTNTGLSADEAVTGLRAILSTILKPQKQTREEFDKLGVSIGDFRAEVKQKGLVPSLDDLAKKIGGNKDAIAKAFPNVRALTAYLALTGANSRKAASAIDSVRKATGTAGKALQAASKGPAFQLNSELSKLQKTGIHLGTELLPAFIQAGRGVEDLAGDFNHLSANQQGWVVKVGLIGAALGPAMSVMGNFSLAASKSYTGIQKIGQAAIQVAAPLAGMTTKMTKTGLAIGSVGTELEQAGTATIGPLGLFGAGLAAITTVGVVGYLLATAGNTNAVAAADKDATRATNDLRHAMANLRSGHVQMQQALLNRKTATEQLAKDERKQAAFEKAHGHASHQLANQLVQDNIDVESSQIDVADAQDAINKARDQMHRQTARIVRDLEKTSGSFNHQADVATGLYIRTHQLQGKLSGLQIEQHKNAVAARLFSDHMTVVIGKIEDSSKALDPAAKKHAALALAAQDLADKLGKIPTEKQIRVYYQKNMADLKRQVDDLRSSIDKLPANKQITVDVVRQELGIRPGGKGHRAAGGPVYAGSAYVVGEQGPELFVPRQAGAVLPNVGGGGGALELTITNWDTGQAIIRRVAAGEVAGAARRVDRLSRMGAG